MAGVLPLVFGLCKKPQGHGYTVIKVEGKNPFLHRWEPNSKGMNFIIPVFSNVPTEKVIWFFPCERGSGIKDHKDGFVYKNVLATYTHIHALGTPEWAESLVKNAQEYKLRKKHHS
jgi:cobyrinic acid a,c-diamide synthase